MIHLDNFKLQDGDYDWIAYRNAQKNNGEICTSCGAFIVRLFKDTGHPDRCESCKAIDTNKEEVTHDSFIRCPACGETMNVMDMECGDLYQDGEHGVCCNSCEQEFEIITNVSYSFKSPARIEKKD